VSSATRMGRVSFWRAPTPGARPASRA
jgi:hypothetical protein